MIHSSIAAEQPNHIEQTLEILCRKASVTNSVSKQSLADARKLYIKNGNSAFKEIAPKLQLVITQVQTHKCHINPLYWGELVELHEIAVNEASYEEVG